MFIKTKYNLILQLIIGLGILLVAGCSGKNKKNGKKIFHYNEHSGIPTLDPAFAKSQATMWPAHQLFNTLVEVNDSLKVVLIPSR